MKKECEIVLFPTAVCKWLEDVFSLEPKNIDDLRDLTLNNFTLCELVTGHSMTQRNAFWKTSLHSERISSLKISPKKGWPQFSVLMCMFSTASSTREKTTPLNLRFQKRKNINKNLEWSQCEIWWFFTIFFPPFSGQIFSPMDSVGVSKLHPFFLVVFFLPPRLLQQSQRRQVLVGFVGVKSRVPWKAGYRVDPDRGRGYPSTLRWKMADGRNMEKAS